MKVKTILVSQPEPTTERSPYDILESKQKVKVDFIPFIHVEGVTAKHVRRQKIDLSEYTSIIMTSRNAVDHFFRIAEEMRYEVPTSLKYFCRSKAVALYLQKYVVYRKRKIYVGNRTIKDLAPYLKKFKKEKFLLPSSNMLKPAIPKQLNKLGIEWKQGVFYKTVVSDLSHLEHVFYDIIVFFSPSGIKSLFENFPDFKQNNTRIAVFGNSTNKEAKRRGLKVNIKVPAPETPSMSVALERYIKAQNNEKKE